MVVDAAQAAPHRPIDVQALDCDFLAFSSHKMCGPSGVGALWGRKELLESMAPFNLGGADDPLGSMRADDVGRAAVQVRGGDAARSPRRSGSERRSTTCSRRRSRRDRAARARARRRTRSDGSASFRGWRSTGLRRIAAPGIVSLNVDGVHPHDVAQVLDWEGVAVRAGHHCYQPLMTKLGVAATKRASFYLYSIPEEIDRLVDGLHKAKSSSADERVRPAVPGAHPGPLQESRGTTGSWILRTRRRRGRTRSAATRSRSRSDSVRAT